MTPTLSVAESAVIDTDSELLVEGMAKAVIVGAVLSVKFAVTVFAESIATMQVPMPVHAPDHPVKVEPFAARITSALASKYQEQAPDVQFMPAGELVTLPVVPEIFVVKACSAIDLFKEMLFKVFFATEYGVSVEATNLLLAGGVIVNV